ncbi:Vacuolar membrane protease [Gryganskiella cystojenkinii]|nr:Vacuolar membrane protease [Gryganskiella cystojenkinii]
MFNHLIQSDVSQGLDQLDGDDSDSASNASSNGHQGQQTYLWSNYSIPQLRELLRQRGQLTTGSKSVMKKRLKTLDRNSSTNSKSSPVKQTTVTVTAATALQSSSDKKMAHTGSEASIAREPRVPIMTATTLDVRGIDSDQETFKKNGTEEQRRGRSIKNSHPFRTRGPTRSNSFSAHFADFISRRRIALETERQEISVYTSPLTVLSYFVLYLLHEFRMALLWIISQQYLLLVLPLLTAIVYFVYQTDGAHQPLLKHAESGVIWFGYWILLGVASSIGLGTGLHTFILFLGPHIAEVTLTAYKCGNTDFDVRGDHRFVCRSPDASAALDLTIYAIFRAVQWESFFWGLGTALGELPPYFVARAAALSGNRNEELAAIEDLIKKKPDSVSYKERILLMVHEGMKRLGFFGIFLCASAVVKSSIQSTFVIVMFSAETLATLMGWLERSAPFIHGYLADGINSQKGALHGDGRILEDQIENSTSLVGLIWNTVIFIMISYFLLSIVETMALAQIKRRHDQEIVELEGKIRSGDTNALLVAVSEGLNESSKKHGGGGSLGGSGTASPKVQ